jgi:hypothetical protein
VTAIPTTAVGSDRSCRQRHTIYPVSFGFLFLFSFCYIAPAQRWGFVSEAHLACSFDVRNLLYPACVLARGHVTTEKN